MNIVNKTLNISKTLIYCLLTTYVLTSCVSSKQSYYFKTLQSDTSITQYVSPGIDPKIVPGDVLSIKATSLSKEEDLIFNQSATSAEGGTTTANPGYKVDANGYLQLPRIGSIIAAGMTRAELSAKIQQALTDYMKGAVVRVSFLNHKVTVLGEVAKPQVIPLTADQLSILDALAITGDITKDGNKNNILIIREEGDKKNIKHINLENHSIFGSKWYYLQANDVVYVMPDIVTKERNEKRRNTQSLISMITGGASLLIIILDRIFK